MISHSEQHIKAVPHSVQTDTVPNANDPSISIGLIWLIACIVVHIKLNKHVHLSWINNVGVEFNEDKTGILSIQTFEILFSWVLWRRRMRVFYTEFKRKWLKIYSFWTNVPPIIWKKIHEIYYDLAMCYGVSDAEFRAFERVWACYNYMWVIQVIVFRAHIQATNPVRGSRSSVWILAVFYRSKSGCSNRSFLPTIHQQTDNLGS